MEVIQRGGETPKSVNVEAGKTLYGGSSLALEERGDRANAGSGLKRGRFSGVRRALRRMVSKGLVEVPHRYRRRKVYRLSGGPTMTAGDTIAEIDRLDRERAALMEQLLFGLSIRTLMSCVETNDRLRG